MKKLLLIATTSATILSYNNVFAEAEQFYVKVEAGLSRMMNDKINAGSYTYKLKPNSSGIIGGGVGYHISDSARVELTLDSVMNPTFKSNTLTSTEVDPKFGQVTMNSSLKVKTNVSSLLMSGYFDFFDAGSVKFFAGAGVGIARVGGKYTFTSQEIYKKTNTQQSFVDNIKSKNTINFAYQVSLGASTKLSDGVTLEGAYSFRSYGKLKKPKNDNIKSNNLNSNNIIVGLRFDI